MKNSRSTLAILGLLAVAASPAVAQDNGIYLGGSWGLAQYRDSCKRANVPCDDRDPAWRFFAGYQFNRMFSAELGLADLGQATGQGDLPPFGQGGFRLKVRAWDLSALGAVPVADRLSALVRLGMYRARTTLDQEGQFFAPTHAAGTNSGWTYGAGLGYNIGRLGLRAEWQRYENVGTSTIGEDEIDVFSIAALWRF